MDVVINLLQKEIHDITELSDPKSYWVDVGKSAEVTLNGGWVREFLQNPPKSGLGIQEV